MSSGDSDDEKTTAFGSRSLDEKTVADVPDDQTVADIDRTMPDDATVDDREVRRVAKTDPPRAPGRDLARTDPPPANDLASTEPPAPIEEPTLLGEEDVAPPKLKKSRFRWIGWFFGILFAAVVVFAIVVAIFRDAIIRAVIIAQAKQHGIDLAFDAVEVHRDHLVFTGARIHADELSDVDLRADHMTVTLDSRFAPTSTSMSALHISISDAPGVSITTKQATADIVDFGPQKLALKGVDVEVESVESLLAFARVGLTPPLVSLSPAVSDLHVAVAGVSPAWPLPLSIDASSISMSAGRATFRGLKTTIPLVDVPIALDAVDIGHEGTAFTVHVPEAPYVELGLDERATTLHIVLKKVPADLLAEKLHWSRPPGFALSADVELNLPRGKTGDPMGSFTATLDHYVPPHPPELDGIVFGDATKGRGGFKLRGAEAELTDLHLDAGDLHMTGTGKAAAADSGKITLSLDGSVPCGELAVSAVAAHLGLAAAFVTGEIASGHLAGTVEVKLSVVIEGKKAAQPEIHPSAFLHCSLAL